MFVHSVRNPYQDTTGSSAETDPKLFSASDSECSFNPPPHPQRRKLNHSSGNHSWGPLTLGERDADPRRPENEGSENSRFLERKPFSFPNTAEREAQAEAPRSGLPTQLTLT
jgi:hypothetical protein